MGISKPSRKHLGFTLIEVLISLSIFTVLIGTMLWGFRQGLVAWEKGSKQQQLMQSLLLRHNWLGQMFNQTVSADYLRYNENFVPYFKGDEQQFSWITAAPLLDTPGNVRPVALKLEKTEQSMTLYYREGELHTDPGRGINWSGSWVELMKSITAAAFIYEAPALPLPAELAATALTPMERKRYRDVPEWMKTYDTRILLLMPRRVKLHFMDAKGQEHNWLFNLPGVADAWSLEAYLDNP
ncbi:MAG: prepilin-type N-terminal cleavage/methylation domain-containing protein [Methylovulum sp.]|nr:prepilin-type N-terminal cleavage/methylation domain-containing protein [Methylovulum sp.]